MPGQAFATYNGQPIFGRAIKMRTVDNPSADQINSFFGANGLESLAGGTRGSVTFVEGVLYGPNPAAVNANIQFFRSYRDGKARPLADTLGNLYPYVKYGRFEPGERIMVDPKQGYFVTYKATFDHLT